MNLRDTLPSNDWDEEEHTATEFSLLDHNIEINGIVQSVEHWLQYMDDIQSLGKYSELFLLLQAFNKVGALSMLETCAQHNMITRKRSSIPPR